MPDTPDGERIEVAPAAEIRSRPLRTGKEFRLVLPLRRLFRGAWDKAVYELGDEAKLAVSGKQVEAPVKLTVEGEDGGSWRYVASVQGEVNADGTEATATFRFQTKAGAGTADGRLTKAEWDRSEAKPGEALGIRVQAEGLDGKRVVYELEREERGRWVTVARWDGKIEKGKAESRYQLPLPGEDAPRIGALVSARFEDGEAFPAAGETTWAVVRATGLDGSALQLEMQRETPTGQWETVGSAAATVKSGVARAALPLLLKRKG